MIGDIRAVALEDLNWPVIPFPHKHDFYQIFAVTKGEGWHEVDFYRYPVCPFQLHFTKLGQVHEWHMSRDTTGYLIEFSREAITRSTSLNHRTWDVEQIPDRVDLSKAPKQLRAHILSLFALMRDEYENEAPDFELALRHYLMPVLIDLHRFCGGRVGPARESDSLVDHFRSLVECHFKKEHGVEFYAKKLKTTSKALTMRVSRATGKSARTVIHGRCILEAKRMLGYSKLTLSEVGYEVGFSDPGYFTRFFRKSTGLRPGEFRLKFMTGKMVQS